MSQKFQFTREEIADELQRCGYPLTNEEDFERFERDLKALYAESNFADRYNDDSGGCNYNYSDLSAADKFYDLPPPQREDVDFSKYYTSSKSATMDVLFKEPNGKRAAATSQNLIKNPPKLVPIPSKSAPINGRSHQDLLNKKSANPNNISLASSTASQTKRKILRKSDDGSKYIDEFMFGRSMPTISQSKRGNLPLVFNNEDTDDGDDEYAGLPPLEDKLSGITLSSGRVGSVDSPIMRRSMEARNASALRKSGSSCSQDDHGALRISDRDNRQVSHGFRMKTGGSIAGSVSGQSIGLLPSVITRPLMAPPAKGGKRVTAQDPVTRYAEYAKAWRAQKAPGEKQHKELRWQIRGQMLAKDETISSGGRRALASGASVLPQRPVSRPNNYVVPTEKKRQALRWAIRSALAAGRQPPTATRYVNRAFMAG